MIRPIEYLSVSSIRQFLSCRQLFHKRYIRKEYDITKNPAMVEGSLFHAVVADYYKNKDSFILKTSIENQTYILTDKGEFDNVNWGKTGSKEKSIKTATNSLFSYFNDLPEVGEIEHVETTFNSSITDLDGVEQPVPLKGIIDLIYEKDGDYYIVDHKLVSQTYLSEEIVPAYEIQACAYYYLTKKALGQAPACMYFDQVKKSKNSDGSPQVVRYEFRYTEEPLRRFISLYQTIISELANNPVFTPNPFDMLNGVDSWNDYCNQLRSS